MRIIRPQSEDFFHCCIRPTKLGWVFRIQYSKPEYNHLSWEELS